MADARMGAFAGVPLFARVPKRHLRSILKRMEEYEYQDGATILAEGGRERCCSCCSKVRRASCAEDGP